MYQVKTSESVFDGKKTHKAGSTITVDAAQAKRIVMRGHGKLLDGNGKAMSTVAAAKELRVNDDDAKRFASDEI